MLIVHMSETYGWATPLQLAVHANNTEFVAHAACQDALTTIWFGKLEYGYPWMLLKVVT